jgi:hypothetical protein
MQNIMSYPEDTAVSADDYVLTAKVVGERVFLARSKPSALKVSSGVTLDNAVMNTGAQTVAGAKTFSTMPIIPTATVAAAGNSQGTAAAITTGFTLVTAADATKGVVLPTAVAGLQAIVKNGAAATLKIYPAASDGINAIAVNSSLDIAADTSVYLVAYNATTWYSVPLLPS